MDAQAFKDYREYAKRCGSTTRYKKSRRCVECKHALSVAEWQRVKARQQVEQRHDLEAA